MLYGELEIVSRTLPGLMSVLKSKTLIEWEEARPIDLADIFRSYSEPGYLIQEAYSGLGNNISDMLKVLNVVGSYCPSLALMMTMHHHSVASINIAGDRLLSKAQLLNNIADDKLLLSSAFAEAIPGADVLRSSVTCEQIGDYYVINGNKKPCTMSSVSDLILVGVKSFTSDNPDHRGVAVVSRHTNGISAEKYWSADILSATDSNKIIFDNVRVPSSQVLICEPEKNDQAETLACVQKAEITALTIFQMMVSASYLGVATKLAHKCLSMMPSENSDKAKIISAIASSGMLIYYLGDQVCNSHFSADSYDELYFSRALAVRKSVQKNISESVGLCLKLLGGNSFVGDEEVRYLFNVVQCLDFHPPGNDLCDLVVGNVLSSLITQGGLNG